MKTQQARKWRWLILMAATLETFLFGGIVFGWGSLVFLLKQEGVFAHLCSRNGSTMTNNSTDFEPHVSRPVFRKFGLNQSDDVLMIAPAVTNQTFGTASGLVGDAASNVTSEVVMTCVGQDDMLSLCFSITSAVLYAATSIAGMIAYKFGTRVSRLVGWVSFTLGSLLVAFTSPENPWLLFGGLVPLGFGGVSLLITNIQIGTLFDKGASTVIATLCGLYDSSSVIMLFIKFAHESGFRRRDSFLALCGLHVLTLVNTVMLMPRAHFTWSTEQHCIDSTAATTTVSEEEGDEDSSAEAAQPLNGLEDTRQHPPIHDQDHRSITNQNDDEDTSKDKEKDCIVATTTTTTTTATATTTTTTTTTATKTGEVLKSSPVVAVVVPMPSLKDCLLSTLFLLEVAWMALLQLRYSFFLASFNPWLSAMFSSEEEVSHHTNVLQYSMMAGLPISLLSGAAFDFFKHVFAKQSVAKRRRLHPTGVRSC